MRVLPLLARDMDAAATLYQEGADMCIRTLPHGIDRQLAYAALTTPDSAWWVLINNDERVIGLGGFERLNWVDGVGEPYIAIAATHRGHGTGKIFGKHLLNIGLHDLRLRRIQTIVLETSPSVAILKHIGFVKEGTMSRVRKYKGNWVDAHIYAKLRE